MNRLVIPSWYGITSRFPHRSVHAPLFFYCLSDDEAVQADRWARKIRRRKGCLNGTTSATTKSPSLPFAFICFISLPFSPSFIFLRTSSSFTFVRRPLAARPVRPWAHYAHAPLPPLARSPPHSRHSSPRPSPPPSAPHTTCQ